MVLTVMKNGDKARIRSITAGTKLYNRLASMGLITGSIISIIQNSGKGPLILETEGSRFALGLGMAEKIEVEQTF